MQQMEMIFMKQEQLEYICCNYSAAVKSIHILVISSCASIMEVSCWIQRHIGLLLYYNIVYNVSSSQNYATAPQKINHEL